VQLTDYWPPYLSRSSLSYDGRRFTGLLCVVLLATRLFAAASNASATVAEANHRLNAAKLEQMDKEIVQAIAEHHLPGGVLWVESHGERYHKAYGSRALVPKIEPMTEDTLFDVASLTKVLATAPALMVLYERGQILLDEPVGTYLAEFRGARDAITLGQLLTHTSGIGRTLSCNPDWSNLAKALRCAGAEPPAHLPGSTFQYSDINFIILGEVVHRVAGKKLEDFVAQEIYNPLKMLDTRYKPGPELRARIAPTEKSGREMLRGTVHDPKARQMGGVAGHAGVFTTASDLARFARMLLNGGELEGVRVLKADTVTMMTSVQTPLAISSKRGLGWDIDSEYSRPRGQVFPLGSFGHTGFTGVCIWLDPSSDTFWFFLSNRVHPDGSGNIHPLQLKLGTLAAEAAQPLQSRPWRKTQAPH
jgi:CubicO group peptidase (beta-lactamase class C family)